MSTRTNILVTFGQSKVYLYRHHDGYPSDTGADLVTKLNEASGNAGKFVGALLAERYEDGKVVYELTTAVHGDIDWAYVVLFDQPRNSMKFGPKIGAAERQRSTDEDTDATMVRAGHMAMPPQDLVRFLINPAIVAENQRLAVLRAKQPTVYGDATDRPLLEMSHGC